MTVITPGTIVQVRTNQVYDAASLMQNVFYVRHEGTEDVADFDMTAAAAVWLDDAYTEINSYINDSVVYRDIEFYNVTADVPILAENWPVLTVGGTTGVALPLQNAALVSFPTEVKRSQGRKYIAGLSEDAAAGGGLIEALLVTALDAWGLAIITGFQVDVEDFVVGHLKTIDSSFVNWQRYRVDTIMRTQQRRILGTGV